MELSKSVKPTYRILAYISLLILPLMIVLIVNPQTETGLVDELGKGFALLGYVLLVLQPILAARVRWIEKAFGLDIVLLFHRNMAIYATILLILHPILMVMGHREISIFYALDVSAFIWIGRVALLILLVQVIISFRKLMPNLKLEKWRSYHNWLAWSILLLGFLHSLLAKDDLQLISMQILWAALLLMSISVYLFHKLIYPQKIKGQFEIAELKRETDNVYTVKIRHRDKEEIPDFLPGQFHFLTLHGCENLPEEEHPFSISSHPEEKDHLHFTIKMSGDFTSNIHLVEPGQPATIRGPFGKFSYLLHPEEKDMVFIAGGIGITPFISMLRHMQHLKSDRKVLLIYANRSPQDIIFDEELREMEKAGNIDLKVIRIISQPNGDWQGEIGYITGERLKEFCCDNFENKSFWICGPPHMQKKLISQLRQMGVPPHKIHVETFAF